MLDPRFKKLSFDGDTFIKAGMRRDGVKWLSEEYNASFKHKVHDPSRKAAPPAGSNEDDEGTSETTAAFLFQPKRRKVTSATFFKPRVPGEANQVPTPATAPLPKDEDVPHDDELAAYLSLPQVDWVSEWDALAWWEKNAKKFPNLSVICDGPPVPRVPGNLCDCRASLLPSWHLLLTKTPESSSSRRCRHHLHKD